MEWKVTWRYRQINYGTTIGTIQNITQRTFIKNNLNGNRIRLLFSNAYGNEPLILDHVVIAKKKKNQDRLEQYLDVTYHNQMKIVIGPNEEFYSDELTWESEQDTEIVISVYIKQATNVESACSTWAARSWYTEYGVDGDYTKLQSFDRKKSEEIYPYVAADQNKANIVVGITAVEVFVQEEVRTIAVFGDSITHMSYYSDALIEELYARYPGKVTSINLGIGGNRILHDATYIEEMPGKGKCFGIAAMKRFEQDLYGLYKPDVIIFLEGINDMMHPYQFHHLNEVVTKEMLVDGVKKLIACAHAHNSKIYLGTVMPFCNDDMEWLPESEKVRNEYNTWIREQELADGTIDFDKVIRDEEQNKYMKKGTHIGDGLHPNYEGGIRMAKEVLHNISILDLK